METTDSNRGDHHAPDTAAEASAPPERLPGIQHLIAVGSGKGGVGKSMHPDGLSICVTGSRAGTIGPRRLGESALGALDANRT